MRTWDDVIGDVVAMVRTGRGSTAYVVVAALAIVVHIAVPDDARRIVYVAAIAAVTIACAAGLRRHRPCSPVTWWLVTAAAAGASLGGVVGLILESIGADKTPAAGIYFVSYGFAVAAAWTLARRRSHGDDLAAVLDTAIVTTGAAILMWVFVAYPLWHTSTSDGTDRVIATAYPMIMLALLAVLVRLAFGGGALSPSYRWLVGGLIGFLVADVVNAVSVLVGNPSTTAALTDSIRLAGFTALGAALVHPSIRTVAARAARAAGPQLGRPRLAALWLASIGAPITLLVRLGGGLTGELAVIAIGSVALFTLVVARMWGLLGTLASYVGREHEDRFRALIDHAHDVIVILDERGEASYASPSTERVWGYLPHELAQVGPTLLHPDDRDRILRSIDEMADLDHGTTIPLRGRMLHADGGWRWFEATLANHRDDPAIRGLVVTARDVTDRFELEQQLSHQAFHDRLTGLPNRALFGDRTDKSLESTRDHPGVFSAVMVLDLDDFKAVNDTLGHDRGDDLLRVVAARLTDVVRPEDTVARLGGDEFAVLLPRLRSWDTVSELAHAVLAAVREPVLLGQRRVEPRASLGIATSTPGMAADELLRDADAAMYDAKRNERGSSFRVFDPTMHAETVRSLQLKMDLRAALDRDQLSVVYQPICAIDTREMAGVEALLRWRHPVRGSVPPAEFIPLAEESGDIVRLGEFVLRRACAEIAAYRRSTGRDVFATVNLSVVQLADPDLVASVRSTLEDTGLPPDRLTLEVTESIFIEHGDRTRTVLEELRDLGIKLAIDDFGTGYCSLAYLTQFRFDVVKLDKSFVDIFADPVGDWRLPVGILELISSLEVPAVAEGIETAGQLDVLSAIRCAYGQGYLLGRPVRLDQLPGCSGEPLTGEPPCDTVAPPALARSTG